MSSSCKTSRFECQPGHMKSQVPYVALILSQPCQGRKWDFWASFQNPRLLDFRLSLPDVLCCQKSQSRLYWMMAEKIKEIMLLLYLALGFLLIFCKQEYGNCFSIHFFLSSTAHEVPVALHSQPGYPLSQIHDILILTRRHSDCYN